MTTWNKVAGDVDDTIVVTLGGIANLDAVSSVEGHVWKSGTAATTLTAAVSDSAAREVTAELGGGAGWLATAEAATWRLEVEATFADGSILTWPSKSYDTIDVRAEGD